MKRPTLWCDARKHVRAPESLHELLEGAATGQSASSAPYWVAFEAIERNFLAEGHGKGERDATGLPHFPVTEEGGLARPSVSATGHS